MDMIDRKDIINKISRMKYEDAVNYFIETLTYYALLKSNQNYFLSHIFLTFINSNLDRFKKLVIADDKLKADISNLFQLNAYIPSDNLVSIIVDETEEDGLLKFLDDEMNFESYYLNDNIMSFATIENKKIFEGLKGDKRKYLFSIMNSLCISDVEQNELYHKVLSEFPKKFVDDLFLYSSIIRENTPNEFDNYVEINKKMFDFTKKSIDNPKSFYNYLYNISKIFEKSNNEKNYYNAFLFSTKYPQIHNSLFSIRINDKDILDKIRLLSSLPILKEITTISDLYKISLSEMYKLDMGDSSIIITPDSADARGNYEHAIFDYNREVIKISDNEIKTVQILDDDAFDINMSNSHIQGLRKLYPEYSNAEVPGEIIIPANNVHHDILMITEGDSLNIWLPNIRDISQHQIELLEEKLNTINDLSIISVTVATELNGDYLNIPFSTIELLIDYLKNFKKVRK